MTDTSSNSVFDLARQLYADAWGKEWPYRSSGTVFREDILPGESKLLRPNEFGDDDDRVNPADDLYGEDGAFPTDWAYTCLHKMNSVATACGGAGILAVQDVLVVRPEYVWLEKTLESGYLAPANAVVVTGQPWHWQDGVPVVPAPIPPQAETRHRRSAIVAHDRRFQPPWSICRACRHLLEPEWLLGSHGLQLRLRRPGAGLAVVATTRHPAAPPETARWKRWAQDSSAEIVISALPTPLEIGAVVKASGLDHSQAGRLIDKWGPCTRTILELIAGGRESLASRASRRCSRRSSRLR